MTRQFRGAQFEVTLTREPGRTHVDVEVDGEACPDQRVHGIVAGRTYQVRVRLPG